MRAFVAGLALVLLVTPALADYYVAGDLNVTWDPANAAYKMTDMGGWYQLAMTGELTGAREFKVTDGSWGATWPGQNAKADFGGDGALTVNFYPGAQADGWYPAQNRVGYVDRELHGWEIMGSFNGWGSPFVSLTAMGGGLYEGSALVAAPGTYEFKFRKAGDWNIAIGDDFSNYEHNISWTTTMANEMLTFQLDLPNGRWNVIPEPTSLLGLLVLGLIRRR